MKIKINKGQMLLELLVAMGLSTVLIPVLMMSLISSRTGKVNEINKAKAVALLKETETAVRAIKNYGWENIPASGPTLYHPVILGNTWTLAQGSTTSAGLTQQVLISDIRRASDSGNLISSGGYVDPSTKKIDITISWYQPLYSSINTTFYLTRTDTLTHSSGLAEFNAGNLNQTQATTSAGGEIILGNNTKARWCSPKITKDADGNDVTINLPDGPPVAVVATSAATTATPNDVFVATAPYATSSVKLAYVNVTANTPIPATSLKGIFTLDPNAYSNSSLVPDSTAPPTGIGLNNTFKTNGIKFYKSPGNKTYALLSTNLPDKEVVAVLVNDGNSSNDNSNSGEFQDYQANPKIFKYWTFFNTQIYSGVPPISQSTDTGLLSPTNNSPDSRIGEDSNNPGSNYSYFKQITIDHTQVSGGDQTNFPVLISQTNTNLKDTAHGGHVQSSNGYDIIFTDKTGTTQLDHEIESYSPTTGNTIMWVRIPTLSSTTDTVINMYYGKASDTDHQNSDGVWSNGFAGVWHFKEGSGTTVSDSTSNNNNGSFAGSPAPTWIGSGSIGEGLDFNGDDNASVALGNSASLNSISPNLTITGWVNISTIYNYNAIFSNSRDCCGSYKGFNLRIITGNKIQSQIWDSSSVLHQLASVDALAAGSWYQVASSFNGTVHKIYLNGALNNSANQTFTIGTPASFNSYLGALSNNTTYDLQGKLDEIHVSNTTRSDGWIATEYNNQKTPQTLISSYGTETVNNGPGPNEGYETNPANAYVDNPDSSSYAQDQNSGTNSGTNCNSPGKDRHIYYNYNMNIPSGATINGVETNLNSWIDNASGSPYICLELSWDGGNTWTSAKSTSSLTTNQSTYTLGGSADTWGRTWSSGDFSNSNFRMRITDVAPDNTRDFFLDWAPIKVYYTTTVPANDQAPFSHGASALAVMDNTGYVASDGFLYVFDLSNIDNMTQTDRYSTGLPMVGCRIELDGTECSPGAGIDLKYNDGETGTTWSVTAAPANPDTCYDGGNIEIYGVNDIYPVKDATGTYIFAAAGAGTDPEFDIAKVTTIPTSSTTPKINNMYCGTNNANNTNLGWKLIGSLDFNKKTQSQEAANSVYAKSDGTRAYISSNGGIDNNSDGIPDSEQFYIVNTTNKSAPSFISGNPNSPSYGPLSGFYYGGAITPTPSGPVYRNDDLYPKRSLTVLNGQRAILVGRDGGSSGNAQEYEVLNIENENLAVNGNSYCGGLDFDPGYNDLTSVSESDGDNFVYLVSNTTDHNLKIIQGGVDGSYLDSGDYTSPPIDLGYSSIFRSFSANIYTPPNTSIDFQSAIASPAAGQDCTNTSYLFTGPGGDPNTHYSTTSANFWVGNTGAYKNPGRCIRYKSYLNTSNYYNTPELKSMIINYNP